MLVVNKLSNLCYNGIGLYLESAFDLNRNYKLTLAKLIECSARTETDLIKLGTTYEYTMELAETLRNFTTAAIFSEIALSTINFVLDWVLDRVIIKKPNEREK